MSSPPCSTCYVCAPSLFSLVVDLIIDIQVAGKATRSFMSNIMLHSLAWDVVSTLPLCRTQFRYPPFVYMIRTLLGVCVT